MIKLKKPFLTDTVKRFVFWNALIFLAILILFNIFLFVVINFILHESIDIRLKHEIENVVASLEITDSAITIIDFSEFNEPDLSDITETPYFLQIYDESGEVLISSKNIELYRTIPIDTLFLVDDYTFLDFEFGNDDLRIGYFPLYDSAGTKAATLQIATFEKQFKSIFSNLIIFNLFSIPVIILIIVIASIILAKKSFSPINKIISIADNISAKNLEERIEYKAKSNDELGRLRDTLNKLFERIETYIDQLSQFTDHASHQLMNPLTAIKAELEYILKRKRTEKEYEETLNKLLLQTDRMIKIVKTLLIISKQERKDKKNQQIFNLTNLIKEKVKPEFAKYNVNYSLEEGIYLKGDSDKFFIAIVNLIDNALKYSDNSPVDVSISIGDDATVVKISDTGIGISDTEKLKVFDRFYRTENSERLGIGGYGLGLSLAQSIVEDMGSRILIFDNNPKGTVITIELQIITLD
ncbi:MAG: HAMP domain-containing histidine kinase [Ignavibacteria bacterium]|nr:HAMP domain-containing histidine kinase [Ignavibacteria bacterium]